MKTYCVKQKKQTECVKGSEKYVKTKNGRNMMKCKCAEYGITKTRYIAQRVTGMGIGETINKKIGDKIPGFSEAQKVYTMLPGVDKELLNKYWSGDIAKGAFNTKTGLFSKKIWTNPDPKKEKASCNYAEKKNG